MSSEFDVGEDDPISDDWAAALSEQKEATTAANTAPSGQRASSRSAVEDYEFPPAGRRAPGGMDPQQARPMSPEDFSGLNAPSSDDMNLNMILDVPVTIAMEIGRSKISIRNLLQLNQGSVVELDRLAGEPLDVMVNGTLIAHGEVVVVNEKFGIRLTDVISPSERVRKLR
jgi:flagellar motor switch protein FliN